MYKNILVTGGSGLVGAALRSIAEQYKKADFMFSSSKLCDLRHQESVIKYVKNLKPDAIIHLAAACGGISLSINHPATLLRDNVLMDINILEASRVCKVKKTVMSLSTGMYSSQIPMPICEEYIHNGPAHDSNYSYAFAKRLIDPLIRAYRAEYGMNVIGLVPNGIFGENSNFSKDASTMLPALIRRLYENKNNNKKIIVWGDGRPLRELTYAKDIARAYMWCLENYNLGQIMHIGTTEEYSVKKIAFMAAEIMGIDKARIEFDTTKPAGQLRKSTDNSKFIALSGFEYTPFREGLKSTIDWFCTNYSKKGKIRK
ncbi:MAG: GDP-L-fucose synthase [Candidatus Omnitrophica bacterium CG11_big_fil_rev_8_21_14_0_20_43_6]|nr:MAG: GDP-L-fucose synthase [Candidatus Omnitrophica bacterium CG11_big_fil_rev_8_21_14_0_20_43_6]